MKEKKRSPVRNLATGVPGLDSVLGGGLPEYSFNLIAGGPGAGKTTLVHQLMFANATAERPALYFTVLGEPTLKMLRYQQQFSFFDHDLAGSAIQFINLSEEVLDGNLDEVLKRMVDEIARSKPGIVVVDSFRTIRENLTQSSEHTTSSLENFIQRLALHLTSWEVTSFLLGEYSESEQRDPIFTVADGVLWLTQAVDRNSVVRKLQVIKTRGQAQMPGLHTFRISEDGLQIFPRIPERQDARQLQSRTRISTGVPGLDEMLGGGMIAGDAVMITGPAGSGKSTITTQFIAEGLRKDEAAVIAIFEEYPKDYVARADARTPEIGEMTGSGKLEIIYLRPLDLSVDETLAAILEAVQRLGATRVAIDSLSGFEVALAPTFRIDFRESLYRLIGALTSTGVTVFMTAEVLDGFSYERFTSEQVSFITDEIIVQRYVEIDSEIKRVMAVIKMRGSDHSHGFHLYETTGKGVVVSGPLVGYHGIINGCPTFHGAAGSPLTEDRLTSRDEARLPLHGG